MRRRIEVQAVWDSELERLLRSLDLFEPLVMGELRCAGCGSPVDLDNLGAIIPNKDGAKVVCDCTPCIQAFSSPNVGSLSGNCFAH